MVPKVIQIERAPAMEARILTAVVALATAGVLPNASLAADITCPASLNETPVLSDIPQGWRALATKGERTLDYAGLYSGDPADMASLVPDDATSVNGIATDIWTVAPGEEYWVSCNYANTSAQLFQKVPAAAKSCAARYTLMSDGQRDHLESVSCQ